MVLFSAITMSAIKDEIPPGHFTSEIFQLFSQGLPEACFFLSSNFKVLKADALFLDLKEIIESSINLCKSFALNIIKEKIYHGIF